MSALNETALIRVLRWLQAEEKAGRVDADGWPDAFEDWAIANNLYPSAWHFSDCGLVAMRLGDVCLLPVCRLTDAGRELLELLDKEVPA